MADPLARFRAELELWTDAHRRLYATQLEPHQLYDEVRRRVPDAILHRVGAAFDGGWLKTVVSADGRHFIDQCAATGTALPNVRFLWDRNASPWWELLVQLADYGDLAAAAEPHGLHVLLEWGRMDVTVWSGTKLVLYVENKFHARDAARLLERLRRYGEEGFELGKPEKGNDALRKVHYLFQDGARPEWFALSAVGLEQVFRIEYAKGQSHRFELVESAAPLTETLRSFVKNGAAPARLASDALALELERLHPGDLAIAEGTGRAAFNVYVPTDSGSAIALGVEQDGRIWTDLKRLGPRCAGRLAEELSKLAIELDTSKQWTYWQRAAGRFVLSDADPTLIVEALVNALGSNAERPRDPATKLTSMV
jgi:hypothetical protein